jgi:hypothetical protein
VATVAEAVEDPVAEPVLDDEEPCADDVPVAVVSVVWPNAREYVLAEPTEPVAAIEAVTSPCFTVLVRYCVVAVADVRWPRNHQAPPARTTTRATTSQRFMLAVLGPKVGRFPAVA